MGSVVFLLCVVCAVVIYLDARRLGCGLPAHPYATIPFGYFPPGGWAMAVLFLGPLGTLLYIGYTRSKVGWAVFSIQALTLIIGLALGGCA